MTQRLVAVAPYYDPALDVRVGMNGLLEWASDKPAMHAAVRAYFAGRRVGG